MKVIQINATYDVGSTGYICKEIQKKSEKCDVEMISFFSERGTESEKVFKYSSKFNQKFSSILSHFFGNFGFEGTFQTKKIIRTIKKYRPDIIHIHNVHAHSFDLKSFFRYVNKTKIKIIWTFHDCWAFTGYCVYFDYCNCYNWKTTCGKCCQYKKYSFFFDLSKKNFLKKKNLLENSNLCIVVPSLWMEKMCKMSFLQNKKMYVINNGVDTSIFKPIKCSLRNTMHLEEKKIILGVAYVFEPRKGLNSFLNLSKILPSDYVILLIGKINNKIYNLPKNIISIGSVSNKTELAKYYSIADIFFNPTLEDNYPTTNLESISCLTPVVTYDTGGSPETIINGCGLVCEKNNTLDALDKIKEIISNYDYFYKSCEKRRLDIDSSVCFEKYISLYNDLMKKN